MQPLSPLLVERKCGTMKTLLSAWFLSMAALRKPALLQCEGQCTHVQACAGRTALRTKR